MSTRALELFFSSATQYYVSGRYAVFAGLTPVVGNLLHHAVEMYLKGALSKTMTLDQLTVGQPATVTHVDSTEAVMLRVMEMGLVPGASVSIRKRAPFGGPLQLQVRGYLLSIRREQAKCLGVEPEIDGL